MPSIMANRLDRLEKLFTGTKKKERVAQEKKPEPKRVFPSPSYLRPTSINMTPRDARGVDRKCQAEDRGRSQSLPGPNHDQSWPSPEHRSPKGRSSRHTRKTSHALPSEVEHNLDSSATPRLSEFRFPEDVLFRRDELAKVSTNVSTPKALSRPSLDQNIANGAQATDSNGSVDCPPAHISSQFDLHNLSTESGTHPEESVHEADRPVLLPSPIITRSSTVKSDRKASLRSYSTTPSPITPPRQVSELKFSLFPKQHAIQPFPISDVISPPASDNGEDHLWSPLKRSISTTSLPTPDSPSNLPLGSPIRLCSPGRDGGGQTKRETRETWCSRHDSTANERVLRGPTLEEFYDLSDYDVAESEMDSTIKPHEAPTPPPKDAKYLQKTFHNSPVGGSHPATNINPLTGDITPPCTPINSKFLTLECGSYGAEGIQGAIWCARIAKKYQFDMVYVVSLWPDVARTRWDPSRRLVAESSMSENSTTGSLGGAITVQPKSTMTGRLLAGYGLDEAVTPFQIGTDAHMKRLKSNDWEEFQSQTVGINELSHGWAHSFYKDYVPVADSPSLADPFSRDRSPNRGIIFAAYTKRNDGFMITGYNSSEKKKVLDRLRADVTALVDALIDWT